MGVPGGDLPTDEEQQKKTAIDALEIVHQRLRLWYQELDLKTDAILEKVSDSLNDLGEQELQLFYNLNDLSLDIGRILPNITYARNVSITTSDTGGTA